MIAKEGEDYQIAIKRFDKQIYELCFKRRHLSLHDLHRNDDGSYYYFECINRHGLKFIFRIEWIGLKDSRILHVKHAKNMEISGTADNFMVKISIPLTKELLQGRIKHTVVENSEKIRYRCSLLGSLKYTRQINMNPPKMKKHSILPSWCGRDNRNTLTKEYPKYLSYNITHPYQGGGCFSR